MSQAKLWLVHDRILQKINQGGQQIERIAPKIIREGIEDISKTPLRLLGNTEKQKHAQMKRKLKSIIKH